MALTSAYIDITNLFLMLSENQLKPSVKYAKSCVHPQSNQTSQKGTINFSNYSQF